MILKTITLWAGLAAALMMTTAAQANDPFAGMLYPETTLAMFKNVIPREIRERAHEVCEISVSDADLAKAVHSFDINGDERPDWGIEYVAACGSSFCGTGGCLIEAWITMSDGSLLPVLDGMVYSYEVYEQNDSRYLVAYRHGVHCNTYGAAGPCIVTYQVNAESLSEVERYAPNAPWRKDYTTQK